MYKREKCDNPEHFLSSLARPLTWEYKKWAYEKLSKKNDVLTLLATEQLVTKSIPYSLLLSWKRWGKQLKLMSSELFQ